MGQYNRDRYGFGEDVLDVDISGRTTVASVNHEDLAIRDTDAFVYSIQQLVKSLSTVAARYRRFPAEPPVGTTLRFEHTLDGSEKTIVYVAFRAPNKKWYVTGLRQNIATWDELLVLLGNGKCEIVTGWMEVPQAEESDAGPSDPVEWAKTAWQSKESAS